MMSVCMMCFKLVARPVANDAFTLQVPLLLGNETAPEKSSAHIKTGLSVRYLILTCLSVACVVITVTLFTCKVLKSATWSLNENLFCLLFTEITTFV